MDSLPVEILTEILLCAEPPSPSTRLTCRLFNVILAPLSFRNINDFTDPQRAKTRLDLAAREARRRHVTSLWSPRCSVPSALPVPRSFLLAMFLAAQGRQWTTSGKPCTWSEWDVDSAVGGLDDDDANDVDVVRSAPELTAANFAAVTGRKDLDEKTLRDAMFRYALYLSYAYPGPGDAPSLWVFCTESWATKT